MSMVADSRSVERLLDKRNSLTRNVVDTRHLPAGNAVRHAEIVQEP